MHASYTPHMPINGGTRGLTKASRARTSQSPGHAPERHEPPMIRLGRGDVEHRRGTAALLSRLSPDCGRERQRRSQARGPPTRGTSDRRGLGVSRVTVRRALGALAGDGIIKSSTGRGSFVASLGMAGEPPNAFLSLSELAAARGLEVSSRVLRAELRLRRLTRPTHFGSPRGRRSSSSSDCAASAMCPWRST